MKALVQKQRSRGFTLVEIMVVVTIFGFIALGLMSFMIDAARGMLFATEKSEMTNDIRLFTERLAKETLGANIAYVYPSFEESDRDARLDRMSSGQSGDCLVLVYTEPYPNLNSSAHYKRVVVYFHDKDDSGVGPIYRTEAVFKTPKAIDTSPGINHFEKFLTANIPTDEKKHRAMVDEARTGADKNWVHVSSSNNFLISGEFLHGNEVNRVTNSFNMSISPRG